MLTQHLQQIDWRRPWLDPWRAPGQAVAQAVAAGASLPGALNREQAARQRMPCGDLGVQAPGAAAQAGRSGIEFVPQAALPPGMGYEHYLFQSGQCPTRENLHDFFNGLVWQTFPRIKRALNALQAAQIAQAGVGKSRGPARDAATIFDENAALLVVRDDDTGRGLVEGLRGHQWHATLFMQRALFGAGRSAEVWLFGHALMEKLVAPRKAITAHTRVLFAPDAWFGLGWEDRRAWIDMQVAGALAAEGLSTAVFTPLPVLGVPGWWPGNEDFSFYDDAAVFRPPR